MEQDQYIFPETLEEASELLNEKDALLISGGTSLRFRDPGDHRTLVDISRTVPDYINIDHGVLSLGSGVRISEILENPEIRRINCGILAETASNIGTTPVRNQITLGGNITMVYRWSDIPVSLLVLDAEIITVHGAETHAYAAEDFFEKHPSRKLRRGEIVKEIRIPIYGPDHYFRFVTFNKTKGDFAAINVAVGYRKDTVFRDLRIGISAIKPLPMRLRDVESELEGENIDSMVIDNVLGKHVSGMRTQDIRYSSDYLKKVLAVTLRRALLGGLHGTCNECGVEV